MPEIAITERADTIKKVKFYRIQPGWTYQERTIPVSATITHDWQRYVFEGWMTQDQFNMVCGMLSRALIPARASDVPAGWVDDMRARHETPQEPKKPEVDVQAIVNQAVAAALAAQVQTPGRLVVQAETEFTVPADAPKRRGRKPKAKAKGGDLGI